MLRILFFVLPQILTKDSVTVAVDAVVYYRINDPTMSVTNVEKADQSTRLLAQTTLRNFLGTKNLSEILADREEVSRAMQVCECLRISPNYPPLSMSVPLFRFSKVKKKVVIARIHSSLLYPSIKRVTVDASEKDNSLK